MIIDGNAPSWKAQCYWHDCENDPGVEIRDVTVKHGHTHLDVGNVILCLRHYQSLLRDGRLNLKWDVIYEALLLEEEECEDCGND